MYTEVERPGVCSKDYSDTERSQCEKLLETISSARAVLCEQVVIFTGLVQTTRNSALVKRMTPPK